MNGWGDSGGMDPGELGGSQNTYNTVKGWSGGGELITGNTSKQEGCQANFKQPGSYTVQFNIVPQGPDAPPQPAPPDPPTFWAPLQCIATIKWTVNGITVQRKVSVANGMSVTGVGEAVTITVEDATVSSGATIILGRTYTVKITVAPGTRGNDCNPPYLVTENIVTSVGGTSSVDVDVPQNAGIKSVMVLVADLAGASIAEQKARVTQADANSTAIAMYDPRVGGFIPLVPGAVKINLANLTASAQVYTVIWGIDG